MRVDSTFVSKIALMIPPRESMPDTVLIIDTTRSMGESDSYKDQDSAKRAEELGKSRMEKLKSELPEKINAIQNELDTKKPLVTAQLQ